jgi:ABC-2 type transport system permease protein
VTELALEPRGISVVLGELRKIAAFVRRDFLVAWSYRLSFFTEIAAMLFQTLTFYFLAQIIDPGALPTYGGSQVTYMQFVAVGIALTTFIAIALSQVALAVRTEQMIGTLESILVTPTAPATVQVGSIAYPLLFIPIRIGIFFGLMVAIFGLALEWGSLGPALAVLLSFVPFVWGLGLVSAAMILTYKRGTGGVGLAAGVLTLLSGAYFPLTVLPEWAQHVAYLNPLALANEGVRDTLLGGGGWAAVAPELLILSALSVVSLAVGIVAFRKALVRERRVGTLGLY